MVLASNKRLKKQIEEKINELGTYFENNKAVILTETDLQCLLYIRLLEIDILSKLKNTKNTKDIFKTHFVHTEVSWFDENKKLTLKPDISLIDPTDLTIGSGNSILKMPAKQFSFENGGIIFELKFNRTKSTKRFLNEIKKDFIKFEKIKKLNNDVFCYFVVFNKTGNRSEELDKFLIENKFSETHNLIYKTSNI